MATTNHPRTLPYFAIASLCFGCSPPDDVVARAAQITEDNSCLSRCGHASCPCPGAAPIPMRFADGTSFAIDATEVTVTSYGKFLATGSTPETGPVAHPDVCTWNTQFAPKADAQDLDPNCATYFDFDKLLEDESSLPVVCVDWCDASAYCAWAGGHLCGLQGGAPMMRDDFGETDEWYSACSSAGTRTYSYGTEFDAKACNTLASGNGSIAITVATLPTCEGPSPGLFDMNGNADEWVAACDSFDTEGASFVSCYRVGGAFFQGGAAQSRCSSAYPGYRGLHGNDTGFRCCYDR